MLSVNTNPDQYYKFVKEFRKILGWKLGGSKVSRNLVTTVGQNDKCYNFPFRVPLSSFKLGPPITSYGCIAKHGEEYLLVKRRDTPDYSDFVRGLYNWSQLYFYFMNMTDEEHQRLIKYDFDTLWNDLSHPSPCFQTKTMYDMGKSSFDKIKDKLPEILKLIPSNRGSEADLWLFPKGKIEYRTTEGASEPETPLECALREFEEETNGLNLVEEQILFECPFVEEYTGTNSKNYKTEYYVFDLPGKCDLVQFPKKQSSIRHISDGEISEIKWVHKNDLHKHINKRRLDLINQVECNLPCQPSQKCKDDWKEKGNLEILFD